MIENKIKQIDLKKALSQLQSSIDGDILIEDVYKTLYATDASAYREKPLGVVRPKSAKDIKQIIEFVSKNNIPIIPRAAGTSLAGQVVGNGIVIDISKYMTKIIEVNEVENWVRVEPGVVLDELNIYLKKYNLFFAPETSTSSRCMLGGMFGNNSCGSHSILYGSTRDHVLEANVILSDGSEAKFGPISADEFEQKCNGDSLENKIHRNIKTMLSSTENQTHIEDEYPRPDLNRRNNGYAIDQLMKCDIFGQGENKFNFCKLLAGSEGTLAFTTEIKLNLVPLPPRVTGVIAMHVSTMQEAFKANILALEFKPGAVELIDDKILECTKSNIGQKKNRFFIKGDPKALLVIEFARDSEEEIRVIAENLEKKMKENGFGYHFPLLLNEEVNRVWSLRKAGLGLLSNIPGDRKAEPFVEDTAVMAADLPAYMEEFHAILDKHSLDCVHYAHVGSGEIHLRPIINLKDSHDVILFHSITEDVAHLVKKYRGSLSGEHGDGRLRGEFIPIIIGEHNYKLCEEVKRTWDPNNIFNPGKIINTPKMNSSLRYEVDKAEREIETIYDFSEARGIQRAAEKCNGSGDCRNSDLIGGTMCPSFRATRDEKHSTRARANILREFLTRSQKKNPFDHQEIYEVMDLCLSCKACKSECPSSVDMAKLKSEFLQHYYDSNGIPLRTRLIANFALLNSFGAKFPALTNKMLQSNFIKTRLGIASKRSLPLLSKVTFSKWVDDNTKEYSEKVYQNGKVYLFNDEFTNYNDLELGIKTYKLLSTLGYEVVLPKHKESGRTLISKGLLRKARKIANKNVEIFAPIISSETPLLGIEPSAILTFRDEYLDLVGKENKEKAKTIADSTLTIEEFLESEINSGKITSDLFTDQSKKIKLHGHCQQKAIASTQSTIKILSLPENYTVEEIPSGCCGMAGSFGYEKEHYEISNKIGELVLFPAVRDSDEDTIICAAGTSCRHQIKEGTKRTALHPVEILYDALKNK